MSTVSARPDNLAAYCSKFEVVDRDLRSTAGNLLQALEAYRICCSEFGRDHTELAYSLGEYAMAMENLDGWVGRVGEAFRRADRAPGEAPMGVVRATAQSVNVADVPFNLMGLGSGDNSDDGFTGGSLGAHQAAWCLANGLVECGMAISLQQKAIRRTNELADKYNWSRGQRNVFVTRTGWAS